MVNKYFMDFLGGGQLRTDKVPLYTSPLYFSFTPREIDWAILMSSPSLEQVEQRLSSVKCAVCKTSQFMVDRRTVQPDGECKGMCKQCRYSFPIHTDMDFYRRTQPDIPYLMKTIPCPRCMKQGVSLDFRIVMSVREAHYFVTCTACSHQFSEKSLLEAFE